MRKALARVAVAVISLLAAAVPAFAQSNPVGAPYPNRFYYASDFGQWQIQGQSANTYLWSPIGICQQGTPTSYIPFATNAPVAIIDKTAANNEVVTPSSVTPSSTNPSSTQCGFAGTIANSHFSFYVTSGTGGLQETLNQISSSNAYPSYVVLDRNWYTLAAAVPSGVPRTMITSSKGSAAAIIIDVTTSPWTYYSWNSAASTPAYVNSGVTGGPTKPTGALSGTGTSGTGGTIATVGNGNEGTVTVTTGTGSITTGAFFTLTWGSSGSFTAAPKACGVYQTAAQAAAQAAPAATQAITYSSGAIDTVTTTAAAAASTVYTYTYNCQAGQ